MYSLLPFLHFFSFIVQVYLFFFVLIRNHKSALNQACAAMLLSFAVWSVGMVPIHNHNTSRLMAILLFNLNSFGWIGFSSFFLWFTIIFTNRNEDLKSKAHYPFIFVLPVMFLYMQASGYLIVDVEYNAYGWGSVWSSSLWPFLYFCYFIMFMSIGIMLLCRNLKKNIPAYMRKQSLILIACITPSVVLGTLTAAILPYYEVEVIPNIENLFGLLWSFGVVYATVKYRFLTLTPAMAADNIISTMNEFLIILDKSGNINTVNKATIDSLGYKHNELHGNPFDMLLESGNLKFDQIEKILNGEVIRNYEISLKSKDGQSIPAICSSSMLKDDKGAIAGIVCVARDITELKEAEIEKNHLIEELQESLNKIKTLSGLIPICAYCKKIRDDEGYWSEVETYVQNHSEVQFTHGHCPECAEKLMNQIKDDFHTQDGESSEPLTSS